MIKVIIEIFSRLRAWFANVDIKNINICGRTYKTELYIVVDTLERIDQSNTGISRAIKPIKKIISRRMKCDGLADNFDRFLVEKKIMKKKGDQNG